MKGEKQGVQEACHTAQEEEAEKAWDQGRCVTVVTRGRNLGVFKGKTSKTEGTRIVGKRERSTDDCRDEACKDCDPGNVKIPQNEKKPKNRSGHGARTDVCSESSLPAGKGQHGANWHKWQNAKRKVWGERLQGVSEVQCEVQ